MTNTVSTTPPLPSTIPHIDSLAPSSECSPFLDFVWLEITGQCNLECVHCYADSSPHSPRSSLTANDWKAVILSAKHAGARTVQFIGGEPTVHHAFADLVRFARLNELRVEVYSNLFRITRANWKLFQEYQVSLATSFYADNREIHDRVTSRNGSQQRTLANIRTALALGLPLRVGITKVFEDQDISQTRDFLKSMGYRT